MRTISQESPADFLPLLGPNRCFPWFGGGCLLCDGLTSGHFCHRHAVSRIGVVTLGELLEKPAKPRRPTREELRGAHCEESLKRSREKVKEESRRARLEELALRPKVTRRRKRKRIVKKASFRRMAHRFEVYLERPNPMLRPQPGTSAADLEDALRFAHSRTRGNWR